ncbi:MAG: peptidoglycan DD-metalloendopeptidase family protein [Pseudohongiellaceae bacterium]
MSGKQSGLLIMLLAALAGCAGGQYQAPLEDRSTEVEQQRPEIVRGGEVISAGSTRSTGERARSGESSETGSTTASGAVVRGVNVGGGISRRSLESRPLEAAANNQSADTGRPATHTVERGDTLYSVAWTYGLDYRRLALANDLTPPYTIYPGQQLQLDERGVSASAVDALPDIPASPAGSVPGSGSGERPRAAVEARRTGIVEQRSRDGVSWQWPGDGRLASRFSGSTRGIDIAVEEGEPVYAAADGDVVYAGRGIQGTGNLVILRHSARHLSAYMHNRSMLVSEGARIRAGDKIAESGRSPDGRGLLHFEIRVDGQPVDPLGFLPGR